MLEFKHSATIFYALSTIVFVSVRTRAHRSRNTRVMRTVHSAHFSNCNVDDRSHTTQQRYIKCAPLYHIPNGRNIHNNTIIMIILRKLYFYYYHIRPPIVPHLFFAHLFFLVVIPYDIYANFHRLCVWKK